MKLPRQNRAIVLALWANAVLLGAILVVMLSRTPSTSLPTAFAQQPPIAGSGGLHVMPGQLEHNKWGAYLLDTDSQTLSVYQWFPGVNQLRLVAAREIRYDHRLKDFNSPNPSPREVKALVEKEQQGPGGVEPKSP